MSDFDGKVVLITGAAGGIGRAAAIGFAGRHQFTWIMRTYRAAL